MKSRIAEFLAWLAVLGFVAGLLLISVIEIVKQIAKEVQQ